MVGIKKEKTDSDDGVKNERGNHGKSMKRDPDGFEESQRKRPTYEVIDVDDFVQPKFEKIEIEGYEQDTEDLAQIQALGLPTDFSGMSSGAATSSNKAAKKKFWCSLCECELTSEIARDSHIKGKAHQKKISIHNQKKSDQGHGQQELGRRPAGARATTKKIPISLHTKIKETAEPIIGLEHIFEFIAESNDEMEPHYECRLCNGTKGIANGMYSHLTGKAHRQAVIELRNPDDPDFINLSQKECFNYAQEHLENDEVDDLITTIKNDADFPWPKGFEPWALENEGTGVAPPSSKQNLGLTKPFQQKRKEILPAPNELTPPLSSEQTAEYLNLYGELMDRVAEYIGGKEGDKLKALHDKEMIFLRQEKNLPQLGNIKSEASSAKD
eukprot:TRINITY_DN1442_c0_g1_i6.p1 TRINITY_DN1442_c0_g1~~TRINITY_DN1442_c0_g1_i6.p1  ORF type:complete len:395 (+),score=113.64 TRINITY_DN1442_c0_g1_i6:33-1187(+)